MFMRLTKFVYDKILEYPTRKFKKLNDNFWNIYGFFNLFECGDLMVYCSLIT